jgi:hypothetical protein
MVETRQLSGARWGLAPMTSHDVVGCGCENTQSPFGAFRDVEFLYSLFLPFSPLRTYSPPDHLQTTNRVTGLLSYTSLPVCFVIFAL